MISETITRRRLRTQSLPRITISHLAWEHVGLGVILALAAALNFWHLSRLGFANPYYAATVRSMLSGWHPFLFASFDPHGFVSVDKPPLGFWLQAAAAKLLGFRGWSLLLPQALAGVLAVALLFHLVRRPFGPVAGLVAALALALSPISVVTNRNNTIDSLLVLAVLCAAWAMTKATATGKLRWLVASMALVGVGFNIKMLEAYLVVPALAAVYLLGTKHGWGKRVAHLALAIVVLLAVSLSWAVAVDLTPAGERPWVGSTTDNSEVSLAIGYNGLQRLLGRNGGPGGGGAPTGAARQPATTGQATAEFQPPGGGQAPADGTRGGNTAFPGGRVGGNGSGAPGGFAGGGPGGTGETGAKGVLRLINQQLGGQIGWLIPFAVVGLLSASWRLFVRRGNYASAGDAQTVAVDDAPTAEPAPTGNRFARAWRAVSTPLNAQQQGVVLWGMWFLTMAAFFSVAGMFHRYYLSMLAPGVAALVGIGVAVLWRAYRQRQPLGWLLLVGILGTAAVQVKIVRGYPAYAHWMTPIILGVAAIMALALIIARIRIPSPLQVRFAAAVATVAILGLLFAPAVWAGVSVRDGGGGGLPAAGPQQGGGFGFPGGNPGGGGPGEGEQTNSALVSYLEANRGSATYLLAVPSSMSADATIIATGEPVMAMGGFSGSDPILTAQRVAHLVQDGTVRFFLLGGGGFGGFGGQESPTQWVTSSCAAVPSSAYQSSTGTTATGRGGFGGQQQLYDCGALATQG